MSIRIEGSSRHGRSQGVFSRSLRSFSMPRISTSLLAPVTSVSVNKSLLEPLNLEIDPSLRASRIQDKEQIKRSNNHFVSFIDKVRVLEAQNKKLQATWEALQKTTVPDSEVEPMLIAKIANLEKELADLTRTNQKLEQEAEEKLTNVSEYHRKFANETLNLPDAENDRVVLKKEHDYMLLSNKDLEHKIQSVKEQLEFELAMMKTELMELQQPMQNIDAVVPMDNSRTLEMDQIVSEATKQHETILALVKAEVESHFKSKFDQITSEANEYEQNFKSTKEEEAALKQDIKELQQRIFTVKERHATLKAKIDEVENQFQEATVNSKASIEVLEDHLRKAKVVMAQNVREHQKLMDIKMALDTEILIYGKYLEGEERRFNKPTEINIRQVPINSHAYSPQVRPLRRHRSDPVLIKTVETLNRVF